MNILLTILAYLLVAALAPFGILAQLTKPKTLKRYFWRFAISLDQLGNVVCDNLLQVTLTKGKSTKFGNPDHTVSYVLGKNKASNSLTLMGKFICYILNIIDSNHVEKAVKNNE